MKKLTILCILLFTALVSCYCQQQESARLNLDSARMWLDSSKFDLSLIYGQKALDIFSKTLGESDTATASAHFMLGQIWQFKGAYENGFLNHQKALDIRIAALGNKHPKVAQSFNEIGRIHQSKGAFEKALEYHQKALKIYLETFGNIHPDIGYTYGRIGVVYDYQGKLDEALLFYNKSLEVYLAAVGIHDARVGVAYSLIGVIYDFKGELDKALEYQFKALEVLFPIYSNKSLNVAACYNNIGIIYRIKGDYERALQFQQKALQSRLAILGKELHPDIAASYNNLAVIYQKKGELTKALEHFQKAQEIRLKIYGKEHFRIAGSFNNIGSVYLEMNDWNQALDAFEEALKIRLVVFGKQHRDVAESFHNLAVIYGKIGELDKALTYHQKALEIRRKVLGENHYLVANSFHSIASVYENKNQLDLALAYHQRALEIRLAFFGEKHPSVADSYESIGILCANKGELDKGLELLKKAIDIRLDIFGADHPEIADSYHVIGEIYVLKNEYQKAVQFSEKAVDNLDQMEKRYISSETKQVHLSNYYPIFENAIHTYLEAAKSNPDQYDMENTFLYSEKAKSKLLLGAVNTSHAESISGIPDSLLQQEYDLKVEMVFYDKKRFEEMENGENKNDSLVEDYDHKLFDLRQSYEGLINRFERDYLDYYNLKHNTQVATVENIQNALKNDQMIIEYFVGDSSIFVFTITKDKFHIFPINKDFPLEKWVEDLRYGVYGYHASQEKTELLFDQSNLLYIQNAHKLYDKLIRPLGDLPQKLIIVPDGIISYIPFEILLTEKPEDVHQFRSHSYLCRRHQISYNFSATLWQEMRDKKHQSLGLLAFAPVFPKAETSVPFVADYRQEGLGPLLFNTKEVSAIHQLLGGKLLVGQEATAPNFVRLASRYSLLHFATHAKVNDKEVDYSYLAFTKAADSPNKIFIRDLYNMRLPADLVVLSACETGIGELRRGEGVISLARGFAYAGAKSIVTSLWSVNDRSTAEIMVLFYRNLHTGMPKDQALQQAKLTYLDQQKDPLYAHPFYWASFVAIGDMAPLKKEKRSPWYPLGGVLVLAAGAYVWRKRFWS